MAVNQLQQCHVGYAFDFHVCWIGRFQDRLEDPLELFDATTPLIPHTTSPRQRGSAALPDRAGADPGAPHQTASVGREGKGGRTVKQLNHADAG